MMTQNAGRQPRKRPEFLHRHPTISLHLPPRQRQGIDSSECRESQQVSFQKRADGRPRRIDTDTGGLGRRMRRWVDEPDQNKAFSSGVEWCGVVGYNMQWRRGGERANAGSRGPERGRGEGGDGACVQLRRASVLQTTAGRRTQTQTQTHRMANLRGKAARPGKRKKQMVKQTRAPMLHPAKRRMRSQRLTVEYAKGKCQLVRRFAPYPYVGSTSTDACLPSLDSGLP